MLAPRQSLWQGAQHAVPALGESLPLLSTFLQILKHWAQLLGDNDAFSVTLLPRTNSVLLPFFQTIE